MRLSNHPFKQLQSSRPTVRSVLLGLDCQVFSAPRWGPGNSLVQRYEWSVSLLPDLASMSLGHGPGILRNLLSLICISGWLFCTACIQYRYFYAERFSTAKRNTTCTNQNAASYVSHPLKLQSLIMYRTKVPRLPWYTIMLA